nr:hypothetical protein GCM10017745_55900 [Saccharothrix mutabilis subsp. capreolus]
MAVADAEPVERTAAAGTTVYYRLPAGWPQANLHFQPVGGPWTAVPGERMDPACAGWVKRTVASDTGLVAVFNNGMGTWDNNNGRDYSLGTGDVTVSGGVVGAGNPCATEPDPDPDPGNNAEVYYHTKARGWTTTKIHYQPAGGQWTAVPGIDMEQVCADWARASIDLGAATGLRAAFNNGNGQWDNNNGRDYTLGTGRTTVKDGVVTAGAVDPCGPPPPRDTTPPSAPTGLRATASDLTVTLDWTASTDDVAVAGYEITRTGGALGTVVRTSGPVGFADGPLTARTTYTYRLRAYDAAGNKSAETASVEVTTGDAPPRPPGGTPLGGDPREDTIYFVMTARFNDGVTANNRGGGQHVRSGNAAHDDPMFRGDFQGLIDKLDYIKGLGFSAVWITPVVLNRSDYDFHGYHGWDFHRVDPRLETPGPPTRT